jgi:hypothetical protein
MEPDAGEACSASRHYDAELSQPLWVGLHNVGDASGVFASSTSATSVNPPGSEFLVLNSDGGFRGGGAR